MALTKQQMERARQQEADGDVGDEIVETGWAHGRVSWSRRKVND
jgi:hypothetical protein